MSKIRYLVMSDDKETAYLVDEFKEILAQMSMSWFYLVNPCRTRPPAEQEVKSVLLRYYQDLSGYNHKNLKKTKKLVNGKRIRVNQGN